MADLSKFEFRTLAIDGPIRLVRSIAHDHRGSFSRVFCRDALKTIFPNGVAQTNLSTTSRRGSVRGMHYQAAPTTDAKIVFCLSGEVADFVVDVRSDSPTKLQWLTLNLSAGRGEGLYIPRGFAHGFQALEDDTVLLYFHDQPYAPLQQSGIHPLDPALRLPWPLPVIELSDRDQRLPLVTKDFQGVNIEV